MQFCVTIVHLDNRSLVLQRTNNTNEHIIYHFQGKKLNFFKEIGEFLYFHICSCLLFCGSLCRSAANHLNATKERKTLVKFYFYHDTSYFPLLSMFASVKSFSKVETGKQQN